MGLFESKSQPKVVKKSFAEQLADVKSVFKKAYEDAAGVATQCDTHIKKKQATIKEIETEISITQKVKDEASAFMAKLKDLA